MNTISSRYYTVDHNFRGEKIAPYTVDVQKLIEDDIEYNTRTNADTLTLSGSYILYSSQGSGSMTEAPAPEKDSQDDFSYYDYFKNIDHFDNKHSLLRTAALRHDDLSERKQEYTDRFALYFSVYAKEYDKIYKEGKISKEEYDDLNDKLNKDAERAVSGLEESIARAKFWGDFYNMPPAKQDEMNRRWNRMTTEERQAEFKAEINKIIQQFCKIDRGAFQSLIEKYRNS